MSEGEEKPKKKLRFTKGFVLFIIIALVLAGVAGASLYKYFEAKKEIAKLSTLDGQQKLAQQEVDALLAKVSKHMLLPEKEKPSVATVTDVESLKKNQSFFVKAHDGDKVIVYVHARKAIIYRPEKDIIVNVGSVAVDDTGTANNSKTTTKPVSVEIRNGTETSGLARTIGEPIASDKNYSVTEYTDAAKKNYTKTIVVDFGRAENAPAVIALAKNLNAQLMKQNPAGEQSTSADVLVIIGADQQ